MFDTGGSKYHLLVWDDVEGEMCWEEDNALHIEDSPKEAYECNIRKDKDKRIWRHTFGVLVWCSPCGVGMKTPSYSTSLID